MENIESAYSDYVSYVVGKITKVFIEENILLEDISNDVLQDIIVKTVESPLGGLVTEDLTSENFTCVACAKDPKRKNTKAGPYNIYCGSHKPKFWGLGSVEEFFKERYIRVNGNNFTINKISRGGMLSYAGDDRRVNRCKWLGRRDVYLVWTDLFGIELGKYEYILVAWDTNVLKDLVTNSTTTPSQKAGAICLVKWSKETNSLRLYGYSNQKSEGVVKAFGKAFRMPTSYLGEGKAPIITKNTAGHFDFKTVAEEIYRDAERLMIEVRN